MFRAPGRNEGADTCAKTAVPNVIEAAVSRTAIRAIMKRFPALRVANQRQGVHVFTQGISKKHAGKTPAGLKFNRAVGAKDKQGWSGEKKEERGSGRDAAPERDFSADQKANPRPRKMPLRVTICPLLRLVISVFIDVITN